MDEFLVFMEENMELAESVFTEYYDEEANSEGELMMGEERFGGDESYDMEPSELYEQYAHTTGHSASYYGASGVIKELGVLNGYDVEEEDEELQWEVLVMLEKEI